MSEHYGQLFPTDGFWFGMKAYNRDTQPLVKGEGCIFNFSNGDTRVYVDHNGSTDLEDLARYTGMVWSTRIEPDSSGIVVFAGYVGDTLKMTTATTVAGTWIMVNSTASDSHFGKYDEMSTAVTYGAGAGFILNDATTTSKNVSAFLSLRRR